MQPPPVLPFHVCRDNISGPLTHRTCGISIALRREGAGAEVPTTNHIFPYFSVIIQSHVAAADIDWGVFWFRVTNGRTRPSSRLSAQSNFLPDVISFCSSPSLSPSLSLRVSHVTPLIHHSSSPSLVTVIGLWGMGNRAPDKKLKS